MSKVEKVAKVQPKFKTQFNGHLFDSKCEKFTKPSDTLQGRALSPRQWINRAARGLEDLPGYTPVFHGDDIFIPDFKKMDMTDIQNYNAKLKAEVDRFKDQFATAQAERVAKDLQAQIDKKVNEALRIKELEAKNASSK